MKYLPLALIFMFAGCENFNKNKTLYANFACEHYRGVKLISDNRVICKSGKSFGIEDVEKLYKLKFGTELPDN